MNKSWFVSGTTDLLQCPLWVPFSITQLPHSAHISLIVVFFYLDSYINLSPKQTIVSFNESIIYQVVYKFNNINSALP